MNSGICGLINRYIHIGSLTDKIICKHGLICKIQCIKNSYRSLKYSCLYGNMKIVKAMIKKENYIIDWDEGLYKACESGHLEIVKLMGEKGANDWSGGLYRACRRGRIEVVKLIINTVGVDDWNIGLYGACKGGHLEIAKLMIDPFSTVGITEDKNKGANDWNWGLRGACENGHLELVKLMIDKGAEDWNEGLYGACIGGHKKLANLMIKKGANYCKWCGNRKHKVLFFIKYEF